MIRLLCTDTDCYHSEDGECKAEKVNLEWDLSDQTGWYCSSILDKKLVAEGLKVEGVKTGRVNCHKSNMGENKNE